MSRQLFRVPLDFDWPLHKIWEGFVNPYYEPCPEQEKGKCFHGQTAGGEWFYAICRLIAMIGEEAQCNRPELLDHYRKTGRIYPHPYLQEWSYAPREPLKKHATKEELARYLRSSPRLLPLDEDIELFVKKLTGEDKLSYGASYSVRQALLKAAGLESEDWGECRVCKGTGYDPALEDQREAWTKTPPPKGEGWQLWETVSEGSPVSEVYPTKEAFIEYLKSKGYSEKASVTFCETGWVPSAIIVDGQMATGVECAAHMGKK